MFLMSVVIGGREVIGCLARFSGGIKYINNLVVSNVSIIRSFSNAFDKY